MRVLRSANLFRGALAVLVVALIVAAGLVLWPRNPQRHISVLFSNVVGLYAGDQVRVLGVPVGTVTAITPQANVMRVDLAVNEDQPLPQQAKAAIVSPSLVSSRYVQLAPVYTGGPQLADGALIPLSRTATPVEWDQTVAELKHLADDLGPSGANSQGALSNLLNTTSANLDGQGQNLHDTIDQLSQAMTTLSDNRDDLFGTVRNLQTFTDVLRTSDQQVQTFGGQLADVAGVLDDNRKSLATALSTMDSTFTTVRDFLQKNGDSLSSTAQALSGTAANLATQRQALADALQLAPTTLANFYNIYDPISGSLTGSPTINNMQEPAQWICATIFNLGGSPEACQSALGPLVNVAQLSAPPVTVTPIQRPGASNQVTPSPNGNTPTTSQQSAGPLAGLLLPGLGGGR